MRTKTKAERKEEKNAKKEALKWEVRHVFATVNPLVASEHFSPGETLDGAVPA